MAEILDVKVRYATECPLKCQVNSQKDAAIINDGFNLIVALMRKFNPSSDEPCTRWLLGIAERLMQQLGNGCSNSISNELLMDKTGKHIHTIGLETCRLALSARSNVLARHYMTAVVAAGKNGGVIALETATQSFEPKVSDNAETTPAVETLQSEGDSQLLDTAVGRAHWKVSKLKETVPLIGTSSTEHQPSSVTVRLQNHLLMLLSIQQNSPNV